MTNLRCTRCRVGIDDDRDGNCSVCAHWPPSALWCVTELQDALSAAQENNARLATALNAAQSELMRRESY